MRVITRDESVHRINSIQLNLQDVWNLRTPCALPCRWGCTVHLGEQSCGFPLSPSPSRSRHSPAAAVLPRHKANTACKEEAGVTPATARSPPWPNAGRLHPAPTRHAASTRATHLHANAEDRIATAAINTDCAVESAIRPTPSDRALTCIPHANPCGSPRHGVTV